MPRFLKLPDSRTTLDVDMILLIVSVEINAYGLIMRGVANPLPISGVDKDAIDAFVGAVQEQPKKELMVG